MAPTKGDQGFPRSSHLRRSGEFMLNRRQGRSVQSSHFTVCISTAPGPGSRLGLAVGRRVGTAVARNRIKRLVREVFRTSRHVIPPALDVVVTALPGAADLSAAEIRSQILGCIGRLAGGPP